MRKFERFLQRHSGVVKTVLMLAAIATLVLSVAAFMPPNQSPLFIVPGQHPNQSMLKKDFTDMDRKLPPRPQPTQAPIINMPQAHLHLFRLTEEDERLATDNLK